MKSTRSMPGGAVAAPVPTRTVQNRTARILTHAEAGADGRGVRPPDAVPIAPTQAPRVAAALDYARRGFRVLPLHTPAFGPDGRCCGCSCRKGAACPSTGKHPRITDYEREATTDPATLRRWWAKWPDANIGVLGGAASGLVVIDIDPKNGGDITLDAIIAKHGPFPTGPVVLTGGGGQHLWLRHPGSGVVVRGGQGMLGAGVDVVGDTGSPRYVVAEPSVHATGTRYSFEWSAGLDGTELPAMPAWLAERVVGAVTGEQEGSPHSPAPLLPCDSTDPRRLLAVLPRFLPTQPGQRHRQLLRLARCLRFDLGCGGQQPASLYWLVDRWLGMVRARVPVKASHAENRLDFIGCWYDSRFPVDGGIARAAFAAAVSDPLPECGRVFADDPRLSLLIRGCQRMQAMVGDTDFALSSHQAAERLDVEPRTANRWLHGLVKAGILRCTHRGTPGPAGRVNSANRWRFVAE